MIGRICEKYFEASDLKKKRERSTVYKYSGMRKKMLANWLLILLLVIIIKIFLS